MQTSDIEARQVEPARQKREIGIDVAAIRARVGGTQDSFARMLGIPAGTLRNWECSRRSPTGAARVLLDLLASDPEIVSGILRKVAAAKAAASTVPARQ